MKRMNEVFLLPVRVGVDDSVVNNDGSYVGDMWTSEMARHTAHAINNIDALADALAGLINDIGGGKKACGHDFSCICAMASAKKALNDYRGAK